MSHAQRAQTSSDVCFVRAYANINLTLNVLGRQADGYHELATVMQSLDLYDTICLTATGNNRVSTAAVFRGLPASDYTVDGHSRGEPVAAKLHDGFSVEGMRKRTLRKQ